MCWREGRSCPLSLPCSPMVLGSGWAVLMPAEGWGAEIFADWVSKGRLTGDGSMTSSTAALNMTQRHLLSTTMTSAALSSQCKSGAWSAQNVAGEGGQGEEAMMGRRVRFFLLCSSPDVALRAPPPRGREHGEPCKATLSLIEYSIFKITLRN